MSENWQTTEVRYVGALDTRILKHGPTQTVYYDVGDKSQSWALFNRVRDYNKNDIADL